MQISNPFSRPTNQDRKYFPLGTSTATPAAGYFASAAGLASEQLIFDAIAELSNEQEVRDVLVGLLGSHALARDFIKWRMPRRFAHT